MASSAGKFKQAGIIYFLMGAIGLAIDSVFLLALYSIFPVPELQALIIGSLGFAFIIILILSALIYTKHKTVSKVLAFFVSLAIIFSAYQIFNPPIQYAVLPQMLYVRLGMLVIADWFLFRALGWP